MPQQLVAVQVAGGETFNVDEVAFSSTVHRTLRPTGRVSNRIFGRLFVRHCISVRSQAHTLTEAEDGDDGRGRYAHALSSSSIRTLQGRITDELQSKSKSGRHSRHRSRFTERGVGIR